MLLGQGLSEVAGKLLARAALSSECQRGDKRGGEEREKERETRKEVTWQMLFKNVKMSFLAKKEQAVVEYPFPKSFSICGPTQRPP